MSSNPQVTIGISAVDTARQTFTQVDEKIKQTTTLVEDSGNKIISTGDKIKQNWQNLAFTATGLVSGVTGFATSVDVLEKAQLRADKAQIAYNDKLQTLQKLQKDNKASADDLKEAQDKLAAATETLRLAQDNVGDTYSNFLANIPGQMLSFGTAAIGMFNMLRTTQIANATASVASGATYTGALAGMTTATGAATAGMGAFRLASIAAFITNPVGLAIIGISTVVLLLVTHFDELVKAAQAVADYFTGIFAPAANTAKSAVDSMRASIEDTISVTDSIGVSVKRAASDTDTATKSMAGSWQKLTSDLEIEVGKQIHLYKTIPNPIGGDLRTPVTMFGSYDASSISYSIDRANVGSIPANFGTGGSSGAVGLGGGAATANYWSSITSGASVKKNALGGEGMVYQPTLFLAGEAGPEHYSFTPGGKAGNGAPATIIFELNGQAIASAIIDDVTKLQGKQTRIAAKSARQRLV